MDTSIFSEINWLAVALAAVAYFMLGAIWYSGLLFGKKWAALIGVDMTDSKNKEGLGKLMMGSFLLIIVTCIALALLMVRMDLSTITSAIKLGLITGICFATTAVSISFIYEKRPTALYFIDCGYHVVGHLAATVVLVLV